MKYFIIRSVFMIIGGALGYYLLPELYGFLPLEFPGWLSNTIVNLLIGGIIFYFLGRVFENAIIRLFTRFERLIESLDIFYVISGVVGALIGLILAWLINMILVSLQIPFISNIIPIIVMVFLGTIGFSFATQRRDDVRRLITQRHVSEEDEIGKDGLLARKAYENFRQYKVLDTSAIIDGRIKDVLDTGFLEGTLVISQYVLGELQRIADSSDGLKRERGRRGLDVLNELQNDPRFDVEMYIKDVDEVSAVDQKLVIIAKRLDGVLVTNDYNLNKVAEFQNVPVLNVNELANAVKPVVIAGEEMNITIVREGSERSQGVGYLQDGTMVIVEDGKHYMNESILVEVTSTLQTSAGRMIFTRPAHSQKAIEENQEN